MRTRIYHWIGGYAEYHDVAAAKIAQWVKQGHSLRAAGGAVSLPFKSVIRWLSIHRAFARMIDIALAERVFDLEKQIFSTTDGVKAKVLLAALQRAAPEAWDDPRITKHERDPLPGVVTLKIVKPTPTPAPSLDERLRGGEN